MWCVQTKGVEEGAKALDPVWTEIGHYIGALVAGKLLSKFPLINSEQAEEYLENDLVPSDQIAGKLLQRIPVQPWNKKGQRHTQQNERPQDQDCPGNPSHMYCCKLGSENQTNQE